MCLEPLTQVPFEFFDCAALHPRWDFLGQELQQ